MKDTYELAITTTTAGDAYNRALKSFTGYDADLVERVQAVQQTDPQFALGHVLMGYVMMLAYSRAAVPLAADACRTAAQHAAAATPRERAHLRALELWIAGDMEGALREWEGILSASPRDVLAVRLLHANYFWLGRSSQMRASLERVAPHWGEGSPGHSGYLACLAFSLEETGEYAAAERAGRRAVELDPTDVWGAHAVAHVLEMQRRPGEGIAWLAALEPHWAGKGAFLHHLWWHRAMFHLSRREVGVVLELYDQRFRNLASPLVAAMPDFYVDVQNAASMLLRLELRGVNVGERWEELADKAQARIGDCLSVWTLPHWMMALAAARRWEAAGRAIQSMRDHVQRGDGANVAFVRDCVLPISEAILARAEGQPGRACDLMRPALAGMHRLGGSHAQQDVLAQLFLDCAMAAGRRDDVRLILDRAAAEYGAPPQTRVGYAGAVQWMG
jgi:tetratricopeptide (TPR) repeat protein